MHLKFVSGEQAFRIIVRADRMPLWSSAVTPQTGSDSQSPYVVVETRS
jgi:hypothetical protein